MIIPRSLDGFDVTAALGRGLDQPTLWWAVVGLFVDHLSDGEPSRPASIGDDALEGRQILARGGRA